MRKTSKKAWNSLQKGYNFVVNTKSISINSLLLESCFAFMKKTRIKQIWRKRRTRIANGGSESSLFLQILEKRGKTDLTGRPITMEEARSYQFAHILPKGMFPEYRLNPENIILVDSIEQHERVDKTVSRNKDYFRSCVDKGTARKILAQIWNHPILYPLREKWCLPLS